MAGFTAVAKCTIVFVVLAMASHTRGDQIDFAIDLRVVALDTSELGVLTVQLELGFVVVEIPVFPVTRVVTSLAIGSQCAFMHVLFFVT